MTGKCNIMQATVTAQSMTRRQADLLKGKCLGYVRQEVKFVPYNVKSVLRATRNKAEAEREIGCQDCTLDRKNHTTFDSTSNQSSENCKLRYVRADVKKCPLSSENCVTHDSISNWSP